jgi:hypothetical protein
VQKRDDFLHFLHLTTHLFFLFCLDNPSAQQNHISGYK